jgi:hypothetical protein
VIISFPNSPELFWRSLTPLPSERRPVLKLHYNL